VLEFEKLSKKAAMGTHTMPAGSGNAW